MPSMKNRESKPELTSKELLKAHATAFLNGAGPYRRVRAIAVVTFFSTIMYRSYAAAYYHHH